MNKLTKIIAVSVLALVPFITQASPTSVDRLTDHIEPLIKTDYIKAPYYVASSTTATSTFSWGIQATDFCTSSKCLGSFSGGVGTSTNPFMATYFVATSTTRASQFPLSSSTQLTTSGATYLAMAGGDVNIGNNKMVYTPSRFSLFLRNLTDSATGSSTITFSSSNGIGTPQNVNLNANSSGNFTLYTGSTDDNSPGTAQFIITKAGLPSFTNNLTVPSYTANSASVFSTITRGLGIATTTTPAGTLSVLGNSSDLFALYVQGVTRASGQDAQGITLISGTATGSGINGGPIRIIGGNGAGLSDGNGGNINITGGNGAGAGGGGDVIIQAGTPSASGFITLNATGGNVGVGTTSPYTKLSVVGEVVARNFTATSSTATSTFAGAVRIAGGISGYMDQSLQTSNWEVGSPNGSTAGYIKLFDSVAGEYINISSADKNITITNDSSSLENFSIGGIAGLSGFATSTLIATGGGLNIASGCFSINNICVGGGSGVSGGTAGMLAAFTSATAITATGTPTAASYVATSTRASRFPYASTTAITATTVYADTIRNTSNTNNVNVLGGTLKDTNGYDSVNWASQILTDGSNVPALNWNDATGITFPQYTSNSLLGTSGGTGTIVNYTDGTDYWSPSSLTDNSQLSNGAGYLTAVPDPLTVTKLNATYASTTAITSTGSAYFATTGGNVGVGTTSPYAKLSVTGTSLTTPTAAIFGPLNQTAPIFVVGLGTTTLTSITKLSDKKTLLNLANYSRPTGYSQISTDEDGNYAAGQELNIRVNTFGGGGRIRFGGIDTSGNETNAYSLNFAEVSNFESVPSRLFMQVTSDASFCPSPNVCAAVGANTTSDLVLIMGADGYITNPQSNDFLAALSFKSYLNNQSTYGYLTGGNYRFNTATSTAGQSKLPHTVWEMNDVDLMTLSTDGRLNVGSTTAATSTMARLSVTGKANTDIFSAASSTNAEAFKVDKFGQVQVKNAVPYFGTGASTAIVCYMSDGALGHITITSLLASGSCVAN